MSHLRWYFFVIFSLVLASATAAQAASSGKGVEPSAPCRLLPDMRQNHDLQQMVRQGDPAVLFCIGERYYLGQGVPQNYTVAAQWMAAAAEQEYTPAVALYGKILLEGQGVASDPSAASRYIRAAAEQGHAEAQASLGYMYEKGIGLELNLKEASAWYARATMQNVPTALFRLGSMYMEGRGVRKDKGQGTMLIFSAALKGQAEAMAMLRTMASPAPDHLLLFKGLDVALATRDNFRTTMHKNSVPVLREDESYFCDSYSLETVVPQGKKMAACYAQGKNTRLSLLRIDYTSHNQGEAQKILADFTGYFGAPTAHEGKLSYLWNFGKMFLVGQYMPTVNETSLIYIIPSAEGGLISLQQAQ